MLQTKTKVNVRPFNPRFHGKKGVSGRKSFRDGERRARVIEKAWEIVERMLHDPQVSLKEKASLAKDIVMKNIPQEHSGIPPTEVKIVLISPKERLADGRPAMVQI